MVLYLARTYRCQFSNESEMDSLGSITNTVSFTNPSFFWDTLYASNRALFLSDEFPLRMDQIQTFLEAIASLEVTITPSQLVNHSVTFLPL